MDTILMYKYLRFFLYILLLIIFLIFRNCMYFFSLLMVAIFIILQILCGGIFFFLSLNVYEYIQFYVYGCMGIWKKCQYDKKGIFKKEFSCLFCERVLAAALLKECEETKMSVSLLDEYVFDNEKK